jgi:tRNA-dependent cyclodipeptide synthase
MRHCRRPTQVGGDRASKLPINSAKTAMNPGAAEAAIDAPVKSAGGNLFIPISLGNHYYSSAVLRRVLSDFIANSKSSVIFLCDRLRLLSYRIRGETDIRRANENIRLQLDQVTRSLINIGIGAYPNAMVAHWSFLLSDPRHATLLSSLQDFVQDEPDLRRKLEGHAAALMDRFGGLADCAVRDRIELQRQYVIEETALSLYMTEIRGYNVEVYRRGMGFVDDLYRERPADLMSLTGKSRLDRRFLSLEQWLAQPILQCRRR